MNKKDAKLIKKMAMKRLKQVDEMGENCIFCDIYKGKCPQCIISMQMQVKKPDKFLVYSCRQYCHALETIENNLLEQIKKCDEVIARKGKT